MHGVFPYLSLVIGVIMTTLPSTRIVTLCDKIIGSAIVGVQSVLLLAVDFADMILQAVVLVVVTLYIGPLKKKKKKSKPSVTN